MSRLRKLKLEIARILKEEGYISNFKATEENGQKLLRVYLKYGNGNEAAISNLNRISKPGCRVYVGRTEIPRVLGGLGINILTTPQGRDDRPRSAQARASAARFCAKFGKRLLVAVVSR